MKTFKLTASHIKLLRSMCVSWEDCEYGAPSIDCKRPYGNSSVALDMIEILGREDLTGSEDEAIKPEVEDALERLHKQTQTALQIVLKTGSFEPGVYEADEYRDNWKKTAEIVL